MKKANNRPRSDAQRAAEARYEAKRPRGQHVLVRLTPAEAAVLDAQRQPREGRSTALKRLAGLS